MAQLMLVNPRRKHKRRRPMTALQRKYFGPRRSRKHRVRRARTVSLAINPRRHRKRSMRINPRHRRLHRRRNPRRFGGGFSIRRFMNDALVPAGIGAVGALGVNVVLGYAMPSLPTMLQSGYGQAVAKIVGAIAVGYVAGMAAGKRFGEQAMVGAVTVTLYDLLKSAAQSAMPTLPLSGYNMGWISPGIQVGQMGEYVGSDRPHIGMGMYVGGADEERYYSQ